MAISALEWRRLLRFARNDIRGRAGGSPLPILGTGRNRVDTLVSPYAFRGIVRAHPCVRPNSWLITYNLGNLRNTVAAVGMKIRSPGFKSGLVSPFAFIGVPWKMKKGVPSSAYFL